MLRWRAKTNGVLFPFYLGTVFYMVSNFMTIPALPLFALALGAGVGLAAVVVATANVVSMSTLLPFGILADRLGRARLLFAGATVAFVGPFSTYFVHDVSMLILARVI